MPEPQQTLAIKVTKEERAALIHICGVDRRTQRDEIMWLIERRLAEIAEGRTFAGQTNPNPVPE